MTTLSYAHCEHCPPQCDPDGEHDWPCPQCGSTPVPVTPDPRVRAVEVAIGLGHTPLGCSLCQKRGILCPTHAAEVAVAALDATEADLRERIARDVEEACAATVGHGAPCSWCVHATRIIRNPNREA